MKKKKKKKWLQEGKFFLDRSRGWIVSSFVCFWLENVNFFRIWEKQISTNGHKSHSAICSSSTHGPCILLNCAFLLNKN